MPRPETVGPDSGPEPPYPIRIHGPIIRGFGRGSKELGIPTANIPITGAQIDGRDIDSGVYYGWAGLSFTHSTADASLAPLPTAPSEITEKDTQHHSAGHAHAISPSAILGSTTTPPGEKATAVYPMVMSIGWNPYYKNEVRSVEVHILHKFKRDFYNASMNLSILGFVRPEQGYESMEALVADIECDIEVARRGLERKGYVRLKEDEYLLDFGWAREAEGKRDGGEDPEGGEGDAIGLF